MVEIERKFLVTSDSYRSIASKSYRIVQAYLNSSAERTVRIRIQDKKAFITVKGKSNESGLSRFEWEKQIKLEDAEELLKICEPGKIDKIRYVVPQGILAFEVDEFHGDHEGLRIAEIELKSEQDEFDKPEWLGDEVTGDKRYYNSQLIKNQDLK